MQEDDINRDESFMGFTKDDWMDYVFNPRFFVISIICLLMYASVFGYIIYNIETVKSHPCQICAEKSGENVICTAYGYPGQIPVVKTFHTDGNISQETDLSLVNIPR